MCHRFTVSKPIKTDVYKRQLDFTSTGMYDISDATKQVVNSLDPSLKIEITVFYKESAYPVSYTHLDVYKRQVHNFFRYLAGYNA